MSYIAKAARSRSVVKIGEQLAEGERERRNGNKAFGPFPHPERARRSPFGPSMRYRNEYQGTTKRV